MRRGHIDYMVHNAGIALRDRVVDTSLAIDQKVMAVNYFGPVAITKALLQAVARGKDEALVGGMEIYSVHLQRWFPTLLAVLIRSHPARLGSQLRRFVSFGAP